MKSIIALILLFMMSLACNSANNERPSSKYEEKKTSLQEMERDSPLKFLKVNASHHSNLVNKEVIEGTVTNKATIVSYKNIELQISFLDKEGSVIEKQKHVLDDVAEPDSELEFKIKTGNVKGAHSISADIISAVADK